MKKTKGDIDEVMKKTGCDFKIAEDLKPMGQA